MHPAPAPVDYRADLDGLRAVAVALVVLFHAGVPGVSGGYVGVDVFFVLSGFLVTGVIQRDLDCGAFSWRAFMGRRIKRLLPAVALMLVAVTAASLALLTPGGLIAYARSLAATTTWAANAYFWQTADYFAEAAEFTPLLHMWSLAVEEQYYLLAPPLALVATRALPKAWSPRTRHLIVGVGTAVASFAFATYAVRAWPPSTFFMLPGRAWELGVGAIFALRPHTPIPSPAPPEKRSQQSAREVLGVVGVALVALAACSYDDATVFPGPSALLPVAGALALIAAGSCDGGSVASRVLSAAPLVWLGQRSYALYLWHWPALVIARHALLRPLSLDESLLVVVVGVGVAHVSFVSVEQRLRFSPTLPPLRFAVASALTGVCTWMCLTSSGGLPSRFPKPVPPAFSRTGEVDESKRCVVDSSLTDPPWGGDECLLTPGQGPRVLLWGDSLAGHLRFGFKMHAAPGARVYQYTTTVCPPILGWTSVARPGCVAFNERAAQMVEAGRFDVVVLAARWEYVVRRQGGLDGLLATLARLTSTRVPIVVVGQTPIFPIDVRSLYLRDGGGDGLSSRAVTLAHVAINERLTGVIPNDVAFVDPSVALCDEAGCRYREDGEFLFHDPAHLSGAGSIRVVERALIRQLSALAALPAEHGIEELEVAGTDGLD